MANVQEVLIRTNAGSQDTSNEPKAASASLSPSPNESTTTNATSNRGPKRVSTRSSNGLATWKEWPVIADFIEYWWGILFSFAFIGTVSLFIAMGWHTWSLRVSFRSAASMYNDKELYSISGWGGIVLCLMTAQVMWNIMMSVITYTTKPKEMEEQAVKRGKSIYFDHRGGCGRALCLVLLYTLFGVSIALCVAVFAYECSYESTYRMVDTSGIPANKYVSLQLAHDPSAQHEEHLGHSSSAEFLKAQGTKIVADLNKEAVGGYVWNEIDCKCFDSASNKYVDCTDVKCVLARQSVKVKCLTDVDCGSVDVLIALNGIGKGINSDFTEDLDVNVEFISGTFDRMRLQKVYIGETTLTVVKTVTTDEKMDFYDWCFGYLGYVYVTFFAFTMSFYLVLVIVVFIGVSVALIYQYCLSLHHFTSIQQ